MKKKDHMDKKTNADTNPVIPEMDNPSSVVSMHEYTGLLAAIPEDREGMIALHSLLPTPSTLEKTDDSAPSPKAKATSKKSRSKR